MTLVAILMLVLAPLLSLASAYYKRRALEWLDKPFEERHPNLDQELQNLARCQWVLLLALERENTKKEDNKYDS